MNIRKKRSTLLCILTISVLLSDAFCTLLSPPSKNEAIHLILLENDNSLGLRLSEDQTIRSWEKEGIVYFFLPSYISATQVVLDSPRLKWLSADNEQSTLRYDCIEKLLFCDQSGEITDSKNICFKHSANLHTIYLDLKGRSSDSLTKDAFVETNVKVIDPHGLITYNESGNSIKGRGNSTWETEKQPYFLKLKKEAALCGMEPDRKWILMANAFDASKILNKLFYDFSKDAGLAYSTDSQWADLYINGEYRGNYLVCEKIDVGKNRIDIHNLEKENETVSPDLPANISGGYIIEKDMGIDPPDQGFVINKYKCFVITSPDNALPEEVTYISDCFQNVDNLIRQRNEAVFQYIDADSFARRFLIEETVLNSDAFITSCYFYKERNDGRIYAGPIWDFDSVLGESNTVDHKEQGNVWLNYDETTVLAMDGNRATTAVLHWDAELYEMPAYQSILKETWLDLLPKFTSLLTDQIDIYADQVRTSVSLDCIRWNYAEDKAGHYSSFDNNIRYMKFFLAKRINFLNRRYGLEELSYEDETEDFHRITCITENDSVTLSVKDGSLINIEELPAYDINTYVGWIYEWDHTPVSAYLPVYEDITLLLEPLSAAE